MGECICHVGRSGMAVDVDVYYTLCTCLGMQKTLNLVSKSKPCCATLLIAKQVLGKKDC